ncbi:hypothetical protein RN001_000640 [Aquatica leii]|uniref:Deacetylase sirtuin-type domain-containing protein n=1 Tax=Aquatica leii TaxID=1421715 RepID=A0AAN7SKP8_9COLE|nr:hypothetical protein RN001_000640 [Aquatica leii]
MFVGQEDTASKWKRMNERVQKKGKSLNKYFHEKNRLLEVGLDFENTKNKFKSVYGDVTLSNVTMVRHQANTVESLHDLQDFASVNEERLSRIRFDNEQDIKWAKSPESNVEARNYKNGENKKPVELTSDKRYNCGENSQKSWQCNKPKGLHCYACKKWVTLAGTVSNVQSQGLLSVINCIFINLCCILYVVTVKSTKYGILTNSKKNKTKSSTTMSDKEDSERESSESSGTTSSGSLSVEALRRYLADKLGFLDREPEEEEKVKVLEDVSIDGIVNYMKSHPSLNIITMAGAGISTSAGIPDFRSPGSGLYHNLQKYKLPHPQAIFELNFFHENPKPFFVLAKELYPGSFKPTKCHYFVKLLHDKGFLLRHYTQNIDTLERVAGIPESKLVEAHGTFNQGHCLECNKEYSLEWMKDQIFEDKIPTCEECPGVVKPDIVFFGENLPSKFHISMHSDFPKCDLLLILGSSLVVQPFASLIDRVPKTTPRFLINREKAGERTGILSLIGMGSGLDFDNKDNSRDVFWLGDCDDGCQLLADKLGWGEELKELVEKEYKRIDELQKTDGTKKAAKEESVDKEKEVSELDNSI